MISLTPSLNRLVKQLSKFPGIGEKTALRLAYFVLKSETFNRELTEAFELVKEKIKICSKCFAYTEEVSICSICCDQSRTSHILCVVEDASDIFRVESSGVFFGKYHVLQGSLSPLEGIQPEDLTIEALVQRVIDSQQKEKDSLQEIIFALDADLEGDTTALYISKILQPYEIKITRLASGVPFGTDIDYIDNRTLGRALENRVQL